MSLSTDEYERRKKAWESIKGLMKPEQEELFKLIRKANVPYTENSNGIFFDIAKLEQPVFVQISTFLDFCKHNRSMFEERSKELDILRQDVLPQ